MQRPKTALWNSFSGKHSRSTKCMTFCSSLFIYIFLIFYVVTAFQSSKEKGAVIEVLVESQNIPGNEMCIVCAIILRALLTLGGSRAETLLEVEADEFYSMWAFLSLSHRL